MVPAREEQYVHVHRAAAAARTAQRQRIVAALRAIDALVANWETRDAHATTAPTTAPTALWQELAVRFTMASVAALRLLLVDVLAELDTPTW
jgi:hypothetical protein